MSTPLATPEHDLDRAPAPWAMEPWEVVVWNDPVNLMSYVVRVFRQYFGYSLDRATELMLAVHHDGHAIVASGPREPMEVHAQAMHDFGLWATIRKVHND